MLPYVFSSLIFGKKRKDGTASTSNTSLATSGRHDDFLDEDGVDSESPLSSQPVLRQNSGTLTLPPLPTEAFLSILSFLQSRADTVSLMLVCKEWSAAVAEAFYLSPPLRHPDVFGAFTSLIVSPSTYHPYPSLVQRLEIVGAAADDIEIGDLETVLGSCQNITGFKLTSCMHVSSILLQSLADFCPRLESLELRGCPIGDGFLPDIVHGCPNLRILDLSETNVRVAAVITLLNGLNWLEKLSMDGLRSSEQPGGNDFNNPADFGEDPNCCQFLQYLALGSGTPVTANLMRVIALRAPYITHLNLSSSPDFISDDVMSAAIRGFPQLTRIEADWCPKLTDVSLQTMAIHRCANAIGPDTAPLWKLELSGTSVTPAGVKLLARECHTIQEVRLDGCARLVGTFVEAIAVEAWVEAEIAKRQAKGSSPTSPMLSPKSPRSRLPLAKGKVHSPSSPQRTGSVGGGGSGPRPPMGWCRLIGAHVLRRVAELQVVMPRLVTLDAFGTLFRISPSIAHHYQAALLSRGITHVPDSAMYCVFIQSNLIILLRTPAFFKVYKLESLEHPNFGHGGIGDVAWWERVVEKVLLGVGVEQKRISPDLVKLIYRIFESTQPFQLYPETGKVLKALQEKGIVIGAISDSDTRTTSIINNLLMEADDGIKPLDFIVTSYGCGYMKPDPRIFEHAHGIAASILQRRGIKEPLLKTQCLHIGDSLKRDYVGAKKAGWRSLLLERDGIKSPDAVQNLDGILAMLIEEK
ncbi:hypothetical protein HDU97_005191 [Phlyctochytrium planicorne]|nr:hypothetical protein HDU97_005191 [Phlyctochytrium planicorne]